MEVSYRPATIEDARVVAAQAHDISHSTAYALGHTLEEALILSARMSVGEAWTAYANGVPVAMFGVIPLNVLAGVAFPWLVTTQWVDQHKKLFYKQSRLIVSKWRERYPAMTSTVFAAHHRSLAWVRRLGFTVGPAEERGPVGLMFHTIKMEA